MSSVHLTIQQPYGTCTRCHDWSTYLKRDGEWFCDKCLVAAIAAGEFTLIEGLPERQESEVEVEW